MNDNSKCNKYKKYNMIMVADIYFNRESNYHTIINVLYNNTNSRRYIVDLRV